MTLDKLRMNWPLLKEDKFKKNLSLMDNDDIRFYGMIVSEKNKAHMLKVITPIFSSLTSVLDIGSGTGQHAIYFAKNMPHILWYTSDCLKYLDDIKASVINASLSNIREPFELDIAKSPWPKIDIDAVFTANTFHMMSNSNIIRFFAGVSSLLKKWGSFIVYGPFIYKASFLIKSDEQLNKWLKNRGAHCEIKHFDDVVALAADNGLKLIMDYDMPDNNRMLHFVKM